MQIRTMKITDYEKVYALWMSCKNMGFNDIDDSKEGIARFLEKTRFYSSWIYKLQKYWFAWIGKNWYVE